MPTKLPALSRNGLLRRVEERIWKRVCQGFRAPKSACCLTKATTEKIKGCVLLLISQHLSLKSFGLQEEIPKL